MIIDTRSTQAEVVFFVVVSVFAYLSLDTNSRCPPSSSGGVAQKLPMIRFPSGTRSQEGESFSRGRLARAPRCRSKEDYQEQHKNQEILFVQHDSSLRIPLNVDPDLST
jgi:hypothetical protein